MTVPVAIDRPVLRYFGGKWRLAPWIIAQFPDHECYVEPFAGAASVLLQKQPGAIEVYNDADGEVVNFFRMLRERPRELLQALRLTPYARAELALSYEAADDPLERARRLYVRCWLAMGGARQRWQTGWRFQRSDVMRSPVVRDWNEHSRVLAVAERFRHVQIERADALTVIERFDAPATLFYLDPPYLPAVRGERWRNAAYEHEFDEEAHRRLAEVLNGIKGMAILSGYPSALYDELYAGWRRLSQTSYRDTNHPGPHVARATTDALWLNAAVQQRTTQGRLWPDAARG